MEYTDFLKNYFDLKIEIIKNISCDLIHLSLEPGEKLCDFNQDVPGLFFITKGKIRLLDKNERGEIFTIKTYEEGEYIVNRKKFVKVMQKYLNGLVSEFKSKTDDYKKRPSSAKLKENFDFLQNSVLKIQETIFNEKYHVIYMDTIENNAKKGFKKQKIMDTYVFNPKKYSLNNQILTQGNKITQFKR